MVSATGTASRSTGDAWLDALAATEEAEQRRHERLVREVLAGGGWVEADADDVVNAFSDQLFPADAPALPPPTGP